MINPHYSPLMKQWPNLNFKPIDKIGQEQSICFEVFPLNTILSKFNTTDFIHPFKKIPRQPILNRHGFEIRIDTLRMILILREYIKENLYCIKCGLKPTHWILEKDRKDTQNKNPHFNLYAFTEYDTHFTEILFTKDHILPASKGGKDYLSNMQLMCKPCNHIKGSTISFHNPPIQNRIHFPEI